MADFLITGVAGFIGSALARQVLHQGGKVRGLDNLSSGKLENIESLQERMDFRLGDLLDPKALASACAGVDYVLHHAAIPSVSQSVADPTGTNRVNVEGTLNLLLAAREAGVKRVVFAASCSAYGDAPELPKREDMVASPISPYAVSKLAGELYMGSFARVYGVETVALRYFNVFGPRQDATSPYSGVLAKFITTMLAGEEPTIFGDGEQSRDFIYVDNVVQANLRACQAPAGKVSGRVFNIGFGKRQTLKETFEVCRELTGYRGGVRYAEARAGDVRHSLADISAAREALGYEPTVDFRAGLERTITWYQEQSPQYSRTAQRL